MSERLGAADPRLADERWMRRAYMEHGDMWIALETGAARGTVRRARRQLGIASGPTGRRRGSLQRVVTTGSGPVEHPTVTATLTRFHAERRLDGRSAGRRTPSPTLSLLADRVRDLHDAHHAGETTAYRDALLGVAAAAMLVHAHDYDLQHAA